MTKNDVIEMVNQSAGSLFTKEDVLSLIDKIETEASDFNVQDLIEEVVECIDNFNSDDITDTSSAEFYLDGSQIMLESIDVDTNHIESEITDVIRNFFDKK